MSLSRNPSMSRGNVFLGASNKKAKVIVLQIKNLDSHVSLLTAERCCTVTQPGRTQVYPARVMHSIRPGLTWFNNSMLKGISPAPGCGGSLQLCASWWSLLQQAVAECSPVLIFQCMADS